MVGVISGIRVVLILCTNRVFKCDGERVFVCLFVVYLMCQYLSYYNTDYCDNQWKINLNGCTNNFRSPV